MKVCIYARVSTLGQELSQQIAACRRWCEYKGYEVGATFQETVSGAKVKRPEYGALLKSLRSGEYDGVVVFRLDRLGRNSRELALVIDELEAKGIKIYSTTENFDTSTPFGRAMREMAYIFAQLEREQIAEATKARLAAVKAAGKKLGRPVGSNDKKPRRKAGYLLRYVNTPKKRGGKKTVNAKSKLAPQTASK